MLRCPERWDYIIKHINIDYYQIKSKKRCLQKRLVAQDLFGITCRKKLQKLGQLVSSKTKGSKNRQKARLRLARHHKYGANSRLDFLRKLSHRLANCFDAIIIEDLNIHDMSQALNFGKLVSDNGWGNFVSLLKYKLEDRGKAAYQN